MITRLDALGPDSISLHQCHAAGDGHDQPRRGLRGHLVHARPLRHHCGRHHHHEAGGCFRCFILPISHVSGSLISPPPPPPHHLDYTTIRHPTQLKTPIATGVFLGASIMYSQMCVRPSVRLPARPSVDHPLHLIVGGLVSPLPPSKSRNRARPPARTHAGSCSCLPSLWAWAAPPTRTPSGTRTTPWPSSPSSSSSSTRSSRPASSASGITSSVSKQVAASGRPCLRLRRPCGLTD